MSSPDAGDDTHPAGPHPAGPHPAAPAAIASPDPVAVSAAEPSSYLDAAKRLFALDAAKRLFARERSLRTTLLAAQLGLLTATVVGFGGALCWSVHDGTYRQAEAELLGAAQLLRQELPTPPGGLSLDETYRKRFGPAPRDRPYFAVRNAAGEITAASEPLPPHARRPLPAPGGGPPRPYRTRAEGPHLDVILTLADGGQVLVGRPLAKEWDALRSLFWRVGLLGSIALGLGGLAAWRTAGRMAEPLERLAEAAERVSARRLDRRVPESGFLEARRTAVVLNTMLARLEAAFRRQTQLTADASHELRTPVAVVLAQAEQTLARERSPEQYRAALDTCARTARRMKRLIDDLLTLAQADAGRLELRRSPCDLADVARQAISLLLPLAEEQELRVEFALGPAPLAADPLRLGQVVTNLTANALRYNRPGGTVKVSTETLGTEAVLIVADTGLGIPAEHQAGVFERFRRVDDARTSEAAGGTGLGLSIVAEIVAAHGGRVELASEPEVGTTFTVFLPTASPTGVDVPPADPDGRETAADRRETAAGGKNVLDKEGAGPTE